MPAASRLDKEPADTDPDPARGPADSVLAAERTHLTRSRKFLRLMREDVLSLRALGGDPVSEEYLKADLYRRAEALRDLPDTPLFFGRLDYHDGASLGGSHFHIGRRHVHDPQGTPTVIDWRAPVSRPFYRASPAGPSRILIEEIERPRSGPMRDIVATIQPDQDDIVRASFDQTVCVQGAPGTGKTAVGLHRVAYLLYAHSQRLSRGGVVVVGPNQAFLAYIQNVLPALGELDVSQVSVADLTATVPVRGTDSDGAARIKGDARMAAVLANALWEQVETPAEPIVLARGSRRWRVSVTEIDELVGELRDRGVRYGTGREMLSHRIAHVILTRMEAAGESCDDRTHESVRRTRPVQEAVAQVWPKADPVRLVFRLLADPGLLASAGSGLLEPDEQAAIGWS